VARNRSGYTPSYRNSFPVRHGGCKFEKSINFRFYLWYCMPHRSSARRLLRVVFDVLHKKYWDSRARETASLLMLSSDTMFDAPAAAVLMRRISLQVFELKEIITAFNELWSAVGYW